MFTEEIDMYLEDYNEKMGKAYDHMIDEFSQIRAGRANPKIIDRIMVDYYGTMTPINQMANITVPEPRMLLVNVWDQSALKSISKAIENANLGLNPSDDGRVIRLIFPQLTEERRKEFCKDINKLTESAKVSCRNERRDVLDIFKGMKKDNIVTEDDMDRLEKEVQKQLDIIIEKIDNSNQSKIKDIMEV